MEVPGPIKDTILHYLYPAEQILDWRQEDSNSSTGSTSTSSDYDSEDSSSEDETVIIVQRPNKSEYA